MDARLKTILAELRSRFEALYGDRLVKLILYGSQARGDAEPDSDIDVLVVLKGPVQVGTEIERGSTVTAWAEPFTVSVTVRLVMPPPSLPRRGSRRGCAAASPASRRARRQAAEARRRSR